MYNTKTGRYFSKFTMTLADSESFVMNWKKVVARLRHFRFEQKCRLDCKVWKFGMIIGWILAECDGFKQTMAWKCFNTLKSPIKLECFIFFKPCPLSFNICIHILHNSKEFFRLHKNLSAAALSRDDYSFGVSHR